MNIEAKLNKFKNLITNCTFDQLLELREDCHTKLDYGTARHPKSTFIYKALTALEDEMVLRGLN